MPRRNGQNADRAIWTELESINEKLGGKRNLISAITSVGGMNNPKFAGGDGAMHVDDHTSVSGTTKGRVGGRNRSGRGKNFQS